ncbi:MAG: hypothetical protein ACRDNW_04420 [Trebonia sp.]
MRLRHRGPAARKAITLAIWPVIITLSPVIILVGEPVNRYVMRRLRRSAPTTGMAVAHAGGRQVRAAAFAARLTLPSSLLLTAISNPLWIALTAPGRWVGDRLSTLPVRRVSAP